MQQCKRGSLISALQIPIYVGITAIRDSIMGKRPAHVKAPAYLSKSPPVPKPGAAKPGPAPDPERPDPVRYGDWELKGLAIDF